MEAVPPNQGLKSASDTPVGKNDYLDLVRIAIFSRELDGRVLSWNQGATETYGWSAQDAVGQISHRLLSTQFPLSQEETNAQLLERGSWEGELVHRRRDGETITVLSNWTLIGDARSPRVLETNRDLTAIRRVAQELQTSRDVLERRVQAQTAQLQAANDALRMEIEERKSAEIRLAKLFAGMERRAAEMDAVFSSLPDAVYVGTDAGIHLCNEAALKMLGFDSPHELEYEIPELAKRIQTRFADTGEVIPESEQPFVKALHGETCVCDVRVRNIRSGEDLVVRSATAPIRRREQVIGAVAINTDITEQKRAKEELVRSQTRLRLALGAAGMVVWEWDLKSSKVSVSGNVSQVLGITTEGPVDFTQHVDLIHPADRPRVLSELDRSRTAGNDYSAEYRIVRPDGAVRWVLDRARFLKADGGPHLVLTGILLDITDRKESEAAIRESDERFRLLAENISDVFWMMEVQTRRCLYVSPSYEQLVGASAKALLNGTFTWPELTHPEDRARIESSFQQSLSTGRFNEEYRITRPDGEERWVRDRGVLLPRHPVHGYRMVGITIDITDRKHSEVALTEKAEQLAQSNADLQQFAYVTSHDLQEPLRTMISFSQILEKRYRGSLDSDADEFLGYIVSGAQRMKGLIDALLSYSRVVSLDSQPLAPVPLDSAVHWAMMNLHTYIEERGAVITLDSLPVVWGDQVQLVQLLQNLIGNAIKYTKPEVAPRVHFSAQRDGDDFLIAVRDNGIGINPQHGDRIFGVFKRLHGQEIPGAGIGLAICKRILEKLGGRIWVESEPGVGSTFYFTLRAP